MVDVVDVVLVVALVAAAVHGLRLGALMQVLTFGGFLVGLTIGSLLSVALLGSVHSPALRTGAALALVLGVASILGAAGRIAGGWSNATLRRHHLGPLDSALGVGVAVVAVLLSAWLVANVVAGSRFSGLNSALQKSDVLRAVDEALPPVPSLFSRVQAILSGAGFPPAFAQLAPPVGLPVAVPSPADTRAIGGPAALSTVKVLGTACGYLQEGSGFVAGQGLVVTNAHVVAGEPGTDVVVSGTPYHATPVLFDPQFDLAVLRTDAPLGPTLTLDSNDVPRGTQGAVLGYPQNGGLRIGAAGVVDELTAQGRDIYNGGLVVRNVYEINADVEPGNSGGPLVSGSGQVIGVVFSRSTTSANVGYALTSKGVLSRVDQALGRSTAVGTGACTQG